MPKNKLLETALKYSKMGWYVFPTRERESEPFEDGGNIKVLPPKAPYHKGGFKKATLDEKQIRDWWEKIPTANIGISCGHSGLVVVDIDTKENRVGYDTWMKMSLSSSGVFHAIKIPATRGP